MRLHPWRAFLLAPLVTPLAFWVELSLESALTRPRLQSSFLDAILDIVPSLGNAVVGLGLVAYVALQVAYPATIVAGLPLWLVARRYRLPIWTAVLAGAVGGVIVAMILAPSFHRDLFGIPVGPWRGGAIGALTAAVWWRLLHERR